MAKLLIQLLAGGQPLGLIGFQGVQPLGQITHGFLALIQLCRWAGLAEANPGGGGIQHIDGLVR